MTCSLCSIWKRRPKLRTENRSPRKGTSLINSHHLIVMIIMIDFVQNSNCRVQIENTNWKVLSFPFFSTPCLVCPHSWLPFVLWVLPLHFFLARNRKEKRSIIHLLGGCSHTLSKTPFIDVAFLQSSSSCCVMHILQHQRRRGEKTQTNSHEVKGRTFLKLLRLPRGFSLSWWLRTQQLDSLWSNSDSHFSL